MDSMSRSMIICVDDDKWMVGVLFGLLKEWLGKNYSVEKAESGPEALEIVDECISEGTEISLVISDYIMPGMKGDELLEKIKGKTPMTRTIMLTGFAAIEGIANAINKAGIYRFMSKPWDNKDMMLTVLQAIRSYEQDKRAEKLASSHRELYHKFQGIAAALQANLSKTITAMSAAVEVREGGSHPGHAARVAEYSTRLARSLGMQEADVKILETTALLHDIGMLGLSDEELEAIRGIEGLSQNEILLRQAQQAGVILSYMEEKLLPGVAYHQERMDGKGPHGQSLTAIPLNARIVGMCNYYDLLTAGESNMPSDAALAKMLEQKGKIFDDVLLDAFIRMMRN